MGDDVEPVSDTILRGPLPGLQTVAMRKVMSWFPEVEGLITVLDGIEESCKEVCAKENGKHIYWLYDEQARGSMQIVSEAAS